MTSLTSIISFCSYDARFLDRCLRGVRPFSENIIVPVCDHLYNGQRENLPLLTQIFAKYPEITFVLFSYSKNEVYGTPAPLVPESPYWARHWHNTSRYIATFFAETTHLLFLDVDEIYVKPLYMEKLLDYEAVRFSTYYHLKRADQVATETPDGPLLVAKSALTTDLLLDDDERTGIFWGIQGPKIRQYTPQNDPIVHHYSWTRPRRELLQKVSAWGHHWERDWVRLIDQDHDFVRGYQYKEKQPPWDPLKEALNLPPPPQKLPENVISVTPGKVAKLELQKLIQS